MTIRAIVGIALLNVLFLAVGTCVLWAFVGRSRWTTYARLAGLAYLVGLALLGVTWTLLLVIGVPLGTAGMALTALGVSAGVAVAGSRWNPAARPTEVAASTPGSLALVAAFGVGLTGLFFEALFRAARLQGLYAFDGWSFWVPKAKVIYSFGRLDEQFFVGLPGPTYPPLVPALDAAAFHSMGGVDVVTLHVQYWFCALGFVAAAVGLLSSRVPSWIVWPFVVLTLGAPRLSGHLVTPQADFLLQFFFALACLLAAIWILEYQPWQLAAATVLLGAAVLTKREGSLLAFALFLGLALASANRWRFALPRLALSATMIALVGGAWRLWYTRRGIGGELPADTATDFARWWDALGLAGQVLFDASLWSVLTVLGLTAVALAAIWGERRLATLLGTVYALIFLGGTWITAAYSELPVTAVEALNPIVRYTASVALLAGVCSPLLLAGVWRREEQRSG